METVTSLTELFSHFDQKVQMLLESLAIKQNCQEQGQKDLIEYVFSQMSSLRINLSLIKNKLQEQKKLLKNANVLKIELESIVNAANYAKTHAKEHLPKNKPFEVDFSQTENVAQKCYTTTDNEPLCDIQLNTLDKKKPPLPSTPVSSYQDEYSKNYVNYLTVTEFDSVPKYMKGRMSYKQINSAIDEIDKTFEIKYKILRQKKSSLPEKKKQIYNAYKEQENEQSQGFPFIIDADLKEHTKLRIDPTLRSIMVILRHCGRIKEIRGGGLTRYAVIAY